MDGFYGHEVTRVECIPLVYVVVMWSDDVSVQIKGGLNLV